MKKTQKQQKNKENKNMGSAKDTMLFVEILFAIGSLWAGGYYEFVGSMLSSVAGVGVFYFAYKRKSQRNPKKMVEWDGAVWFGGIMVLAYLIACVYATDKGMAFTGVAKKSAIFNMALLLTFLEAEQRKKLLSFLPHAGCILCGIGAVGSFVPGVSSYIVKESRFSGTFGYANTFALFLCLGMIEILTWKKEELTKEKKWLGLVELLILGIGLWATGSRFTWILFAGILLVMVFTMASQRKILVPLLALFVGITGVAGVLSNQMAGLGRLFQSNFSTLYGRLLYWQDAWQLIKKHPFGMGYLGYYYEQTGIQTGVYTVRYVHNDLIQWVLDIGWIPALLLLGILLAAICNKKRSPKERILLLTILLHSVFEFDLEHTAMGWILVLVLSCTKDGIYRERNLSGKYFVAVAGVLSAICLYMTFPLGMYGAGNYTGAFKMYPPYTDAQIAILAQTQDMDTAENLANTILAENDTVALAYTAKAQIAYSQGNYKKMADYGKGAIARNPFDSQEYLSYLSLLNEASGQVQGNQDSSMEKYLVACMKEVPELIKKNKERVSFLGKKIDDKVEIDLDKELLQEIESIVSD